MSKRNRASLLAIAAAVMMLVGAGVRMKAKPVGGDAIDLLPASDAVVYVNVDRLLNDALPRVFAADPKTLAEFNREIDNLKNSTKLDPRAVEGLIIGARVDQASPGQPKFVIVMRGRFDAPAFMETAANATKNVNTRTGNRAVVRKQAYNGKTIYFEDSARNNAAGAALDANTVVAGDLALVRAAIDCGARADCAANGLATLAASNKDALIGVAGNNRVAAAFARQILGLTGEEMSRLAASVQEFNGSVAAPGDAAEMFLSVRTEEAERLAATFAPLRTLDLPEDPKPGLIPFVDGFAAFLNLFKGLEATAQGSEAQFRLSVPFARIVKFMRRATPPVSPPPPAAPQPRSRGRAR